MKSMNRYTRRNFIKLLGWSSAAYLFFSCKDYEQKTLFRPNIVYILADDMGYGDIGCLNLECKIPTPNIDRLAKEGMSFTDAHSGSAVCTPTRYGILTGRYAWRSRLKSGVFTGYSPALIPPHRLTMASFLKKHGYTTACMGKWHLGWDWATSDGKKLSDSWEEEGKTVDYTRPITNGPNDVGFDYFFGIPASLDMVPYVYIENNRVIEPPTITIKGDQEYKFYRGGPCAPNFRHEEVLPKCTEKVIEFIENQAQTTPGKPFFVYFPMSAPHTPILPIKEFQGKTGLGPYTDFVCQCDAVVGQIMKTLEKSNLSENTIFIFASDNGCSPMANFEHLKKMGHNPSYIFRGYKADIYEGGHRIPFIVRWPSHVKAGTSCEDTICLTDLLATVADIMGEKLPDNAGEDSFSLLENLLGYPEKPTRGAVVHHSINGSFSIRQGKWKLELCPGSGGWSYPRPQEAKALNLPRIQLYDLSQDIAERQNLQAQHPDVVYRITNLLQQYVENGRSTPGRIQSNEGEIQLWKMLESP